MTEIASGISFDLMDPVSVEFIQNKPIFIRNAYNLVYDRKDTDKIKAIIRKTIHANYVEGSPIQKAAENIHEALSKLANITIESAKTIARTEIIGASNYGAYVAIRNSGFKKKEWVTARDSNVRELHRGMEGRIIGIDDLWEFSDGSRIKYPGDNEGPEHLIVNCRCIETVVPSSHRLLNPRTNM